MEQTYTVYVVLIHLTHFSIGTIEAECLFHSLFRLYTVALYVCCSSGWINLLNYDFCLQLLKPLVPGWLLQISILHFSVHCYYTAIVVTTSADDSNRCSYTALSTEYQWADSDSVPVLMFDGGLIPVDPPYCCSREQGLVIGTMNPVVELIVLCHSGSPMGNRTLIQGCWCMCIWVASCMSYWVSPAWVWSWVYEFILGPVQHILLTYWQE